MSDTTSVDINNHVDVQIHQSHNDNNGGTLDANQHSVHGRQDNPFSIPLRRSIKNISKPVKIKDYEL